MPHHLVDSRVIIPVLVQHPRVVACLVAVLTQVRAIRILCLEVPHSLNLYSEAVVHQPLPQVVFSVHNPTTKFHLRVECLGLSQRARPLVDSLEAQVPLERHLRHRWEFSALRPTTKIILQLTLLLVPEQLERLRLLLRRIPCSVMLLATPLLGTSCLSYLHLVHLEEQNQPLLPPQLVLPLHFRRYLVVIMHRPPIQVRQPQGRVCSWFIVSRNLSHVTM